MSQIPTAPSDTSTRAIDHRDNLQDQSESLQRFQYALDRFKILAPKLNQGGQVPAEEMMEVLKDFLRAIIQDEEVLSPEMREKVMEEFEAFYLDYNQKITMVGDAFIELIQFLEMALENPEEVEEARRHLERETGSNRLAHRHEGNIATSKIASSVQSSSQASQSEKLSLFDRIWKEISEKTRIARDNIESFLEIAEKKNEKAREFNEKLQFIRNFQAAAEAAGHTTVKMPAQEKKWLEDNGFWPKGVSGDVLKIGQLEAIKQNISTSVQTLGQEGELNLIKLQSAMNLYQQTHELLSNLTQKFHQLAQSIISNLRS